MKLFKRTSIFLSILIMLIWVFLFVWFYYPLNNVRVTEVEKTQIKILLEKNNITVPDEMLNKKVKAVDIPRIIYTVSDTALLEDAREKGKIVPVSDTEYTFADSKLTVSGKSVTIEGYSPLVEKNTPDTALSNAKKLVEWLKLPQKNMAAYVYERQDGILVTFVPEYKGSRIFDCRTNVMVYGEGKYKVETVPFELKAGDESALPGSPCSVLAELALSDTANGTEISEMTLGYKTNGDFLKPVWEVKTEDNNVYYVG